MEQLSTVHKLGIIHRDISPDNIIITADGRPILLDFGAARAFQNDGQKHTFSVNLKHGFTSDDFRWMSSSPPTFASGKTR